MLHQIVVKIVNLATKIAFVANLMLRVSRLPDVAQTQSPLVGGHGRFPAKGRRTVYDRGRSRARPGKGEASLDLPPARRRIDVVTGTDCNVSPPSKKVGLAPRGERGTRPEGGVGLFAH